MSDISFEELMDVLRNRAKFNDRYSARAVEEIERRQAGFFSRLRRRYSGTMTESGGRASPDGSVNQF